MLTWAMLADPDGYLVGLVKAEPPSSGSAPRPTEGGGAAVDWFEVLGSDAERTQRFYCDLFGWTYDPGGFPGYRLIDTGAGEDAVGGGLGASSEGHGWATVYAHVPNVEETLARAESLGGSRIYGPSVVDDHMQTGALRDPAGNVFGVYEHPDHD
jgi:predicted enzyme related to lactoylglutathione lyase